MKKNLNGNNRQLGSDRKNKSSISKKNIKKSNTISKEINIKNKLGKLNTSPTLNKKDKNSSNKKNVSLNSKNIFREVSPFTLRTRKINKNIHNKKDAIRNNFNKKVYKNDYDDNKSMFNYNYKTPNINPQLTDSNDNYNMNTMKNIAKKKEKVEGKIIKKDIKEIEIEISKDEKSEKTGISEDLLEEYNKLKIQNQKFINLMFENIEEIKDLKKVKKEYKKKYEELYENFKILENKCKNYENNNNLNEINNLKNIIKEKDKELNNFKENLKQLNYKFNSCNKENLILKKENKEIKDKFNNNNQKYRELKNNIKKIKNLNLNNSENKIFNSIISSQNENPSSESEKVNYSPEQINEIWIQYNGMKEYLNKYFSEIDE